MKTSQKLAENLVVQMSYLAVNCRKMSITDINMHLTAINDTQTALYFAAGPQTRLQDLLHE